MENVAAGQSEALLQIRRRQHLSGDHRIAEVRRKAVDGGEYRIGGGIPVRVPVPVAWEVLAEQARDVVSGGARESSTVDGMSISMTGNCE